jgi:uncharacterized protein (TIGR03000 family)
MICIRPVIYCCPVIRCGPVIIMPAKPDMKKDGKKDGKKDDKKDGKGKVGEEDTTIPAPAKLVVTLPADATLTIDGNLTTSTSGLREFVSPKLEPGKDFHYTLKATVMRDGKPLETVKTVAVHAGAQIPVTLTIPDSVAAR